MAIGPSWWVRFAIAQASFVAVLCSAAFAQEMGQTRAPVNLKPVFEPSLRAALQATQIVGPTTLAVPSFRWTIEYTRPFKKPRISQETYLTIDLNGLALSSVKVLNEQPKTTKPSDEKPDIRPSYSVRGLERVQEGDTALSFTTNNLKLPLASGQVFEIAIEFEKQRILQKCSVGAVNPASSVHSAIPGQVFAIACKGNARYMGVAVTLTSSLSYFDRLGFFHHQGEDIESPLGNFQLRKKITAFSLL
jgi:hypothetical protein